MRGRLDSARAALGAVLEQRKERCGARALLGWAFVVLGCATPVPPSAIPPAPVDDGAALAALLPSTFDRCVVARPGRLPARRRGLAVLHAWAEGHAYERELGLTAYASAVAESADGRRARRSLYRFATAGGDPRARAAALGLRFEGEPCRGGACRRPTARWRDARTLEVARHPWPEGPPRSDVDCATLARARPRAFEVAVDRQRLSRIIPSPESTTRVLTEQRGVHIHTEHRFASEAGAIAFETASRLDPSVFARGLRLELGGDAREVRRIGDRVVVEQARAWEDLELALEDEALRRRAMALERRRAEPGDVEQVEVSDLEVVEHQLRLRRARLARLSGAARTDAGEALVILLDRARQAHPGRVELSEQRVRLTLDVLARPDEAQRIVEEALSRATGEDERALRLLRRETLARRDVAALSRALREDGLVTDVEEAERAATDLAALARAAVPYEWAEGAWAHGREALAVEAERRPVSARLPLAALIPTLVGLAAARGEGAPPRVVFVARALGRDLPARAVGAAGPDLVVVRDRREGARIVGAGSGELLALRGLSQLLAEALPEGEVEVLVDLSSGPAAPGPRLRLGGRVAHGILSVSWASPELLGVPWDAVSRYLATPLAELSVTLFPPPELRVVAESEEVAQALGREASRILREPCTVAGPVLRCASPGDPQALGEVLLALARARLR